jgi:hypothetical protein
MVPSGPSLFTLADRPPLDQGGSAIGPIGPSGLGPIIPPSLEGGRAVPWAPRRQQRHEGSAVSHERRAESR